MDNPGHGAGQMDNPGHGAGQMDNPGHGAGQMDNPGHGAGQARFIIDFYEDLIQQQAPPQPPLPPPQPPLPPPLPPLLPPPQPPYIEYVSNMVLVAVSIHAFYYAWIIVHKK
ncbi:insulin receptor substrate 4-like [Impatiens glandulifera]|uniref:insulin receptor substrate 4-like n=1 Tax=Impatiens glandulifera TaxID=253017 RepID=UPI001FB11487|nr:insulin receptor substrate 4-like [Impatiens glandulifera]XP_047340773.1 insulin receptor substrate 4-like [Impatiens glandulifera]XP_047341981.1 insulin receptor substrate 4-like [Impatiens glandulifera]XP_047341982.1 insulin receptor substrate 4-like [Impatiens glandulifera]XP_047342616.1 insulin receptor substrate 4-like [Impatiens glandulifera]XP_047342618.1 insulin receptor substrate 4-like [Impatiens glandulifera]XP_047342666.1 insulin receptor substrate 4-like [Impatiens glandulifer